MEVGRLRGAADTEWAAYGQSRDPRERATRAWRLFEICCAYEQVNADLFLDIGDDRRLWCYDASRSFAELASQMASQLVHREPGDGLDDVVARCRERIVGYASGPLGGSPELPESYVRLPECFMRDLLDLSAYTGFVHERLTDLAPAALVVVGIRTTGSYLAPVWDAVSRAHAVPTVTLTARPKRNPRLEANGRFTDASPTDQWLPPDQDVQRLQAFLTVNDPRTVSAVVIDDLAFTGSQFVRVDNYLRSLGIAGTNVVFVQNTPLVMTSLTPTGFERLSSRRVWSAPRAPDGPRHPGTGRRFFGDLLSGSGSAGGAVEVVSARLAPATFAQRYLAAGSTVPVDQFVHFNPRGRDRHYLVEARMDGRPVQLFAKLLGTGFFAEQEARRIRQFADVAYRVADCRGGFLFYEWIVGEPLGPDDSGRLTGEDVAQVAEYAARLGRLSKCGYVVPEVYAAAVLDRLGSAVDLTSALAVRAEAAASAFVGKVRGNLPMVNAPRNQGYWHHIRANDGQLRRVHLDLGEWSWRMDVAEELAAAVIELGLSPAQAARLVTEYRDRSGDVEVEHRITMATLSYVARTLDMYRFWAGQLEQIPGQYRRPADDPAQAWTRRRQARLLRGVQQALAGGQEAATSA